MANLSLLFLGVAFAILYIPFVGINTYNSVKVQTIYYLGRPHEGIPTSQLSVPSAWKGQDLNKPAVTFTMTEPYLTEIQEAIKKVEQGGISMRSLRKEDFPLPLLSKEMIKWKNALKSGIGVQLIKGLPVTEWTEQQREIFFWALGLHMGTPGAQNTDGDLLGHVKDTGANASSTQVRGYLTNSYLKYHCDASDVVGLMCVNKAKVGGTSRLVSSVSIFNEILRQRPDLAPLMFQDHYLDTKGSAAVGWLRVVPSQYYKGRLSTFWHSDYFRSSRKDYPDSPPLTKEEEELLELFDKIASDPEFYYDMDLEPGDIQFISNHVVVHSRSNFVDHPEPERKRHLLRLWLTLDDKEEEWQDSLARWVGILRVLERLGHRYAQYYFS